MEFIENRPISCNSCGHNPVFGNVETYKRGRDIVTECRWTCPRCCSLIRCDERIDDKKE